MNLGHKHTVLSIEEPIRINDYLIGVFASLPSRKSIKKALQKERILVDGQIAMSALWVVPKMEIVLQKDKHREEKIYPIELDILFEDDFLAIVNKPAGLLSSGNKFRTLQNALAGHIKKSSQIDAIFPPVIVHRLDSATSGLVIVAKTLNSSKMLGEMLAERRIKKKYAALLIGEMQECGKIESLIDQKIALTEFNCEKQILSDAFGFLSWVSLYPLSGRTHQLRIHMAANKTPILGDRIYNKNDRDIKGKGLFLSAIELQFIHPISKEELKIEIPLPKKFAKYWEWTLKRNAM